MSILISLLEFHCNKLVFCLVLCFGILIYMSVMIETFKSRGSYTFLRPTIVKQLLNKCLWSFLRRCFFLSKRYFIRQRDRSELESKKWQFLKKLRISPTWEWGWPIVCATISCSFIYRCHPFLRKSRKSGGGTTPSNVYYMRSFRTLLKLVHNWWTRHCVSRVSLYSIYIFSFLCRQPLSVSESQL